ncbi:MAG: M28 family peptidase [Bacteroidota bacterium]
MAQSTEKGETYLYGRKIVDTLASAEMRGRGYVNDGGAKAASFIREEFKKLGLKPITSSYYQSLSFPVNTFPSEISVEFDNQKLIAGKDYIISPSSPSASDTGTIVVADDQLVMKKKKYKKFINQDFSKKILYINDTGKLTKELHDLPLVIKKPKAIVIAKDKLTWSVSQKVSEFPTIEVLRNRNAIPKVMSYNIENKYISEFASQNVIGLVEGSVFPDSFIVFTAHYDHLGQMGSDVYFPGANDNASGSAMLLSLAKYYSMPAHKPKYSFVFMAFCGEEAGLLGSKYYTEHPVFSLNRIRFLVNMDIMGTGEEGITVVNGSVFTTEFDKLKQLNAENHFIKDVKIRGKAANSDHSPFTEKGVKAFFIYSMGGIKAYHDIYDKPETLPLNEFDHLYHLIIKFGDFLQQVN